MIKYNNWYLLPAIAEKVKNKKREDYESIIDAECCQNSLSGEKPWFYFSLKEIKTAKQLADWIVEVAVVFDHNVSTVFVNCAPNSDENLSISIYEVARLLSFKEEEIQGRINADDGTAIKCWHETIYHIGSTQECVADYLVYDHHSGEWLSRMEVNEMTYED